MDTGDRDNLGEVIRQQRLMMSLTLQELAAKSGVSSSHLGRIERGERYPSPRTLQKIAKPLGFGEDMSHSFGRVDPYVAAVLSQEPVNVQRSVIGILTILKSIAESATKESNAHN